MFCVRCGAELSDDTRFCPHCGARVNEPVRPAVEDSYRKESAGHSEIHNDTEKDHIQSSPFQDASDKSVTKALDKEANYSRALREQAEAAERYEQIHKPSALVEESRHTNISSEQPRSSEKHEEDADESDEKISGSPYTPVLLGIIVVLLAVVIAGGVVIFTAYRQKPTADTAAASSNAMTEEAAVTTETEAPPVTTEAPAYSQTESATVIPDNQAPVEDGSDANNANAGTSDQESAATDQGSASAGTDSTLLDDYDEEDEEDDDESDGQIFPDSSDDVLSKEDISDLTDKELQLAINEIYARHGYHFGNKKLRRHYENTDWYEDEGITDQQEAKDDMNKVEKKNLDKLAKERSKRK